jgi:ubiquinone/menaquinone biosynthesis C-methylase UbiE
MPAAQATNDRATFERLVARTAERPTHAEAIRSELAGQTLYQPRPDREGLDELAALLARRFAGDADGLADATGELERAFPGTPLVHLYAFALRRETGEQSRARESLDALLEADAGDPMAASFDADLRSEAVTPASEEQRMANIAKLASTPLLRNPYSLAVGVMFEAIREIEHARVLDVGIGSGAQMAALIDLLGRNEHRVRRLEIVALDCMPEFLAAAGRRIADATEALADATEVAYQPVEGRIEALDAPALRAIAGRGLDAANASIALHEVSGESKLAALRALRRLAPARLVIAEWNYCLENVLAETSTEFVFNVRSVAAAMVASLRERYAIEDARAVVRDWLSQGAGQLTCASEKRQECFLQVTSWRALLRACDFEVNPIDHAWLAHATDPKHATVAQDGSHIDTSHYAGAAPIALLVATPSR